MNLAKTRPLLALLLTLAPAISQAAPPGSPPTAAFLRNESFADPTPGTTPGEPVVTPPAPTATGSNSASAFWSTWANTPNTQIVSWLASAPDGIPANLVFAGGDGDGLVQVLADGAGAQIPLDQETDKNLVSVWVYVVKGRVGVQLGNGGYGGGSSGPSSSTGRWERLSACGRADMRNNEVTLYADGPAIFYAYKAAVGYSDKCR